jgi:hypothetical protein
MKRLTLWTGLCAVLLLAGCDSTDEPEEAGAVADPTLEALAGTGGLDPVTVDELKFVRARTRVFQDANYAQAHGFVLASPYVPQMGYHYVRFAWVDGTFDMKRPEALLYVDDGQGGLTLVGVEYVVPTALSPEAPAGFTGEDDVWEVNAELEAWTLHAWLWQSNPEGVFVAHNPMIP